MASCLLPFCWGPETLQAPGGLGGSVCGRGCVQLHCLPAQAGPLKPRLLICKMGAAIGPRRRYYETTGQDPGQAAAPAVGSSMMGAEGCLISQPARS